MEGIREYIKITKDNKDIQVLSKKSWMRDRIDEGLVFLKADARGKCFILMYLPFDESTEIP